MILFILAKLARRLTDKVLRLLSAATINYQMGFESLEVCPLTFFECSYPYALLFLMLFERPTKKQANELLLIARLKNSWRKVIVKRKANNWLF